MRQIPFINQALFTSYTVINLCIYCKVFQLFLQYGICVVFWYTVHLSLTHAPFKVQSHFEVITNFTEFARTRFKTKEIVSYSVQSNCLFLKKTVIIKDDKKDQLSLKESSSLALLLSVEAKKMMHSTTTQALRKSRGLFLETPEYFFGPKSQLSNCHPLVLKS